MFTNRPIVNVMDSDEDHSNHEDQAVKINKQQIQVQPQATTNISDEGIDKQTIAGRFGWAELEPTQPGQLAPNLKVIPFIYRHFDLYCSVRMLQMQLSKYPLHSDIEKCVFQVRTYPILRSEIALFDEINFKHCDGQFGCKFSINDRVLSLRDAKDWYQFWTKCYRILTSNVFDSSPKKCGFLKVDELMLSFVMINGTPLVPLIHFVDVSATVIDQGQVLRGWDLAYLKFCWTVMGFKTEFMEIDCIIAISMEVVASQLKQRPYELYWPSNEITSKFLVGKLSNIKEEQRFE